MRQKETRDCSGHEVPLFRWPLQAFEGTAEDHVAFQVPLALWTGLVTGQQGPYSSSVA